VYGVAANCADIAALLLQVVKITLLLAFLLRVRSRCELC
jgi:hypothetical protein